MTRLTAEYLEEIRKRKNRYMGQWTGTAGALAADCHRLLMERETLLKEIRDMQDVMDMMPKAADAALEVGPLVTTSTEEIPVDWILRGERELKNAEEPERRPLGSSLLVDDGLRPGSREFIAVLDEIKQLHLRKTMDYGVDEDALSNIRSSADIVNMPAWAGCILRMSDKMHRIKAFFRRGKVEFDGIEDTLIDFACYAIIALVLFRESDKP